MAASCGTCAYSQRGLARQHIPTPARHSKVGIEFNLCHCNVWPSCKAQAGITLDFVVAAAMRLAGCMQTSHHIYYTHAFNHDQNIVARLQKHIIRRLQGSSRDRTCSRWYCPGSACTPNSRTTQGCTNARIISPSRTNSRSSFCCTGPLIRFTAHGSRSSPRSTSANVPLPTTARSPVRTSKSPRRTLPTGSQFAGTPSAEMNGSRQRNDAFLPHIRTCPIIGARATRGHHRPCAAFHRHKIFTNGQDHRSDIRKSDRIPSPTLTSMMAARHPSNAARRSLVVCTPHVPSPRRPPPLVPPSP